LRNGQTKSVQTFQQATTSLLRTKLQRKPNRCGWQIGFENHRLRQHPFGSGFHLATFVVLLAEDKQQSFCVSNAIFVFTFRQILLSFSAWEAFTLL
jgi:hypothetical protein